MAIPLNEFESTIGHWIASLHQYQMEQLQWAPAIGEWSMGQLYAHLINETAYYRQQIGDCLETKENRHRQPSAEGQAILKANRFPGRKLKGPPGNPAPSCPASKEEILNSLLELKAGMTELGKTINRTECLGKTMHPGFGYLNAEEWFRIGEMHLRHHFRQQQKLESAYPGRQK